MKQCIALAGVVCFALSGCAQSGVLTQKGKQPMHVARSLSAPRPMQTRPAGGAHRDRVAQASFQQAQYEAVDPYPAEAYCEDGYCGDGYCSDGCCDDVCCGDGCTGDCGGCCLGNMLGGGARSAGERMGAACDAMRQGYQRWDGRCWRFVDGMAGGFCPHSGGYPAAQNFQPGPPTGQVAYPYYTVRGPRDFLIDDPPRLGPY